MEVTREIKKKEEAPDADPNSCKAPEGPDFPSAEDEGEECPLEAHSDQGHPGSAMPGLPQYEERRDTEEEAYEEPAGGTHFSVPVDGKDTESLKDSSKHKETMESRESPATGTSNLLEPEEPVVDEDVQVMAGSGEAAVETTQPKGSQLGNNSQSEVPSQDLKDPDIKQEQTE